MKVAVVGKGGVGKTTVSAVLARSLGQRGLSVIALDCDTNPNLGVSLGVGEIETERLTTLRQQVDEGAAEHARSWDEIIDRFGSDAPDGVRLGVVNRIEHPEPSCPCCGVSPERLLSQADAGTSIVVGDFEAGLGVFARVAEEQIDTTIVVVEPTPRALDVGLRALDVARERQRGRLVIVANKVTGPDDVDTIRLAMAASDGTLPEIVVVPFSDAVVHADRQGVSVFDIADHETVVTPLRDLSLTLVST